MQRLPGPHNHITTDTSSFPVSSYSFQVATNQDPFPTTCNASFTTAFVLPEVPFTACNDSNYIWSFRAVGLSTSSTSNYTLVLAHAAEGLAAAKIWDAAEFPTLTSGATSYPQYTGPTSFVIS